MLHLGLAAWVKACPTLGLWPFFCPRVGTEASAVVVRAPNPSVTCHLFPQALRSSAWVPVCSQRLASLLKASVLAGSPRAMSNDPPPPYPGGPSAPLIEEKHGPPPAAGTALGCRGDIAERAGARLALFPGERPGYGLSSQLSGVTILPSGEAGGPRGREEESRKHSLLKAWPCSLLWVMCGESELVVAQRMRLGGGVPPTTSYPPSLSGPTP